MSKAKADPKSEPPQLYLFTPPLGRAIDFAPALQEALAGAQEAGFSVASVYLDVAGLSDGDATRIAAPLAPLAQAAGAAVLVNDPRVAGRIKGDGVHVRASGDALEPALEEAAESMRPDRIVGAGLLRSRHDAMTAGEGDVDYICFGEPSPDGWRPDIADTLERVSWWADVFNVPCVGFAGTLEEAVQIAEAGADFVAIGDAIWSHPLGPRVAMEEVAALIAKAGRTSSS
jgi:thiamine-phosphate pyrophosphorylase